MCVHLSQVQDSSRSLEIVLLIVDRYNLQSLVGRSKQKRGRFNRQEKSRFDFEETHFVKIKLSL